MDKTYLSLLCFSTFLVLQYALLIPLIIGVFNFERHFLENGKAHLWDLFYAFESIDTLTRSYKIALFFVFKSILYFLPSICLVYFIYVVYYEGIFGETIAIFGTDVIFFSLCVLLVIFTSLALVFSAKNLVGIYVSLIREDEDIAKCFFVAQLCVSVKGNEPSYLVLSFLPLCIVSLFTLGFLFIIYTLPYMAIAVTMISKYLYDGEMNSTSIGKLLYEQNNFENNTERM